SYTVRAANTTVNGPGWVQATVSGLCGDVELPPYSVYVGTPPGRIGPPLINGQSVFCIWPNQSATVSVTSHPEVTNYLWVLHNEAEFTMLLGNEQTTIPFSISGNYPQRYLELTEQIPGCSSVTSQKNLVFCEDFDMLSVGPNPASEVITIAELDNDKSSEPWTLRLVSQQGAIAVNVTTTLPKTISVSGMQQGIYILHAQKGNHVEQHRVVVK
ncbi:MAG: T9SS type A sorting domain-containing protein, partial [Bacteroidales bacterium]|nr:T9SS type A sorting domain-containing protein [Bacteroidales bacterium]